MSRYKGFTLIELLIGTTLGISLILMLMLGYQQLSQLQEKYTQKKLEYLADNIVLTLQKQLIGSENLSYGPAHISYITRSGLTYPYVMVIIDGRGGTTTYKELDPMTGKLIFERDLPIKISITGMDKKRLLIKINETQYVLLLRKRVNPVGRYPRF